MSVVSSIHGLAADRVTETAGVTPGGAGGRPEAG